MSDERCTWLIEVAADHDGVTPYHECGRKVAVVFSIRNPQRGPNQPKTLRYPRCKTHATPAARAHADTHGYDTQEVE